MRARVFDDLRLRRPQVLALCLDIIGWSLGAAIASNFTRNVGNKVVRKLMLHAMAGADPDGPGLHKSPVLILRYLPLCGDYLLETLALSVIKKGYAHMLADRADDGKMLSLLVDHAKWNKMLGHAIVLTISCDEMFDNTATLAFLGESRTKDTTLITWCELDKTVPTPRNNEALCPLATHKLLKDVGHGAHLTHPEVLFKLWLNFLV